MLRICNLAGESLATFSADEVEGKSVKELKKSLAKQIGATRFQQRWLTQDHTELQDDAVVPCCDVQLVVLPYIQTEKEEIGQLVSACRGNRLEELVDLLRKPLNPYGMPGTSGNFLFCLHWAAKEGHLQIARLLLEAGIEADIHFGYKFGPMDVEKTALHIAAENGHPEVVKLFVA